MILAIFLAYHIKTKLNFEAAQSYFWARQHRAVNCKIRMRCE